MTTMRNSDKNNFIVQSNSNEDITEIVHETKYEEPEGLDKADSIDLGDYPIDSVLIRNEPRTVFDVIRRIKKDQYILNPDFQRDFVWEPIKQSRLIESALMRIPLPVFYLAETKDGKIIVVDGLQRLNTFLRFLNNEFSIKGLHARNSILNGKRFKDLSPKFQSRIEDTNLILYLIDPKVPERARLDIFERVNSGEPLTRQQMRNCLYVGKASRWLKKQANQDYFLRTTGRSLNPKTMRDREIINRFCGFSLLGVNQYKGDMDNFLADTLIFMNKMKDEDLAKLEYKFQNSMVNNYQVFQRHAFRKHYKTNQARSVINASLFDVFSVLMAEFSQEFVKSHAKEMRETFFQLMNDESFIRSVTYGTNDLNRVKARFSITKATFREFNNVH